MRLNAEQAKAVLDFATAILHGDDIHREWLLEAADCYVEGQPLPPPRQRKINAR